MRDRYRRGHDFEAAQRNRIGGRHEDGAAGRAIAVCPLGGIDRHEVRDGNEHEGGDETGYDFHLTTPLEDDLPLLESSGQAAEL